MNFTVTKDKDIVTVTVVLPAPQRHRETGKQTNRTKLRENHVRDYLRKSKIAVGECVQTNDLDNMGVSLTAVWKFNTSSQKTLDKTPPAMVQSNSEVTSIPEEETKAGGLAAKRKRRKTTAKKAD